MYQLSILIPSAHPDKLAKLLNNLKETMCNFDSTEIVICLDGYLPTERIGNMVWCFSPPSKFRSTFHEKPYLEATGRFMMMANDDMEFVTKNWDLMIPYDKYPDDYVLFHFKDNTFNESFACHPIFSRKATNLAPELLSPLYQITKCDNTIWDIHPAGRRIYLPEIEIIHHHTDWGPAYKQAYKDDNIEYAKHQEFRIKIRNRICQELGMTNKVLIGVPTAESARMAIFYDYFNQINRPEGTVVSFVHGQSIAHNRNQMVKLALDHGCTHIFFLDDDVLCKPDIIYQLMKHDKDVVCALQLARNYPHRPYVFHVELPDGRFGWYNLSPEDSGLLPIKAAGFGAILIKTRVFEKLQYPWLRYGQIEEDQLGEDLDFFTRINKIKIKSYCDLDCYVGHIASAAIWPQKVSDNWYVTYDTYGPNVINFLHSEQLKGELV